MHSDLDLTSIDPNGVIAEAEDAIDGDTRADFFKKAGILGGPAFAASMLAGVVPSFGALSPKSKSAKQDLAILNYALTLEYLESTFYNEALASKKITGDVLTVTKIVAAHENAHVKLLKSVLGSKAIKKPTFDFKGLNKAQASFVKTAISLEDTGVSAYSGQALNILSPKIITTAISIVTVEARHASAFRRLGKQNFAPNAQDKALTQDQVLAAAGKFIKK